MKSQVLHTVWCHFLWGCRGILTLITLRSERVNIRWNPNSSNLQGKRIQVIRSLSYWELKERSGIKGKWWKKKAVVTMASLPQSTTHHTERQWRTTILYLPWGEVGGSVAEHTWKQSMFWYCLATSRAPWDLVPQPPGRTADPLFCSLKGCIHDGYEKTHSRSDSGGDQEFTQRGARPASQHGRLHLGSEKGVQICVWCRHQEIRGVDDRVWLNMILQQGPF